MKCERCGKQLEGLEYIKVLPRIGSEYKLCYDCHDDSIDDAPNILQGDDMNHKDSIEPKHYRNKNGKDLYQEWYERHDIDIFRHIMRAIAERYTRRYENKNGLIDLEKGIYTLERLKEYEEMEK